MISKRRIFLLTVFYSWLVPFLAQAQANPQSFQNPLGTTSVYRLLTKIITYILSLGAVIALLALIVGALQFILAFGSEDKIKKAKTIILWSILGLALMGLSFLVIVIVGRVIGVAGV